SAMLFSRTERRSSSGTAWAMRASRRELKFSPACDRRAADRNRPAGGLQPPKDRDQPAPQGWSSRKSQIMHACKYAFRQTFHSGLWKILWKAAPEASPRTRNAVCPTFCAASGSEAADPGEVRKSRRFLREPWQE